MKNALSVYFTLLLLIIISCKNNHIKEGLYALDKKSLEEAINATLIENQSVLSSSSLLINNIIRAAKAEIKIEKDSINGIFSFMGTSTELESKLNANNDTTVIHTWNGDFILSKSKEGLCLYDPDSKLNFELKREESF